MSILEFSLADKVFLKTAVTTGFWLESRKFFEVCFDGDDEVIDIFPHKDLENEGSVFFEKGFCDLENRQIELYRTILIDARHARGGWRDI